MRSGTIFRFKGTIDRGFGEVMQDVRRNASILGRVVGETEAIGYAKVTGSGDPVNRQECLPHTVTEWAAPDGHLSS